jgi:hypothetical protein
MSGISRRDFLKRAGQEAVDKGADYLPGPALTKTVLGDEKTGKPPIWKRLAGWRKDKTTKPTDTERKNETQDEPTDQ